LAACPSQPDHSSSVTSLATLTKVFSYLSVGPLSSFCEKSNEIYQVEQDYFKA
jgi:hypothetical protein